MQLTIIPAKLTMTAGTERVSSAPSEIGSKYADSLRLRAGDWVEVRSLDEIVATLDENGCLAGLPFMPEMVQYCGRRFRVYKSAHKTCDTIDRYVIRRMESTVHLEGLRCGGESHGGCQAGCLLFWKEAWLKRASTPTGDGATEKTAPAETARTAANRDMLLRTVRVPSETAGEEERYRCQATELLKATSHVRRRDQWDPRFYLQDLWSGNVPLLDFIRYGLFAMLNAFLLRWRGTRYPRMCGLAGKRTPTAELNLREGELVRVRSKHEIMQTLSSGLKNRGLWFDVEMLAHCGAERRVLRRVERIVDEKTGRLISFPQPCIILDGVTCSGNLSTSRMFCPRAIYPYWREIWLEHGETRDSQGGDGVAPVGPPSGS